MKLLQHLLIQMSILAGTQAVLASGVESSMTGFELKSCSATNGDCLVVKAAKSQGSQLRPIQRLSKPEVTILTKDRKTVLEADTGYVDLAQNQVVIYQKKNNVITETSINLNSFERFDVQRGGGQ